MKQYFIDGFLSKPNAYEHSDPLLGFDAFAESFNHKIETKNNILIGYSMGGRLALHCLKRSPELFSKVIIISTHPGLQSEKEKKERLFIDEEWAKAFEQEPWDLLMERWDAQSVFSGEKVNRNEKDYSRKDLANCLRGWSLGRQKDFRQFLREVEIPILWVTGEKDEKFTKLGEELLFSHPESKHEVVPGVGHRILNHREHRERIKRF